MLYNDDCINVLKDIDDEIIDLIFADPPYFLSNGGISYKSGKIVCVDKGEWDKKCNYGDHLEFTKNWLKECFKILKRTGSIWIMGTKHNVFDVGTMAEKIGFKIQNIIIWKKTDPPPLIIKKRFRFSYEMIIWATKSQKYTFNYENLYNIENKEMSDVWNIEAVPMNEKLFGYHPTQKPVKLLERIILSTSKANNLVLDPFMGSGTCGYVAVKLNRQFIGIEKEKKYFEIAKNRINSVY